MPRAEDYDHQPISMVSLEWLAKPNDPNLKKEDDYDQEHLLRLDLAVHPNKSGRIIINYPGYKGDINGYFDKHRKLAQYMQGEGLGAIVRGKGPSFPDFDGFTFDTQLRQMIAYSQENAKFISGVPNPEIFIIGTSAGGGAAAAIAHEYKQVTRILLMAPGTNIGGDAVRRGLQRFTGEVYIVIGHQDEVVGVETGQRFYDLATGARKKELFIIPNCDHQFRGELNGRIMSQAPFYAFAENEKPRFPDPKGGIILYS